MVMAVWRMQLRKMAFLTMLNIVVRYTEGQTKEALARVDSRK
jgi:hypothetical protein